jgi:1,4-alpha-glucan branching enzyme
VITKAWPDAPGPVRVTFELPGSVWAENVFLVGEFNDWNQTATPMLQSGSDGAWRVTLELEPERAYQYRYLIDGEIWHTDYGADGFAANEYGSDNSIVRTAAPGPPAGGAAN